MLASGYANNVAHVAAGSGAKCDSGTIVYTDAMLALLWARAGRGTPQPAIVLPRCGRCEQAS